MHSEGQVHDDTAVLENEVDARAKYLAEARIQPQVRKLKKISKWLESRQPAPIKSA